MRAIILGTAVLFLVAPKSSEAAAPCVPIKTCDYTMTPPCLETCPNLIIRQLETGYSLKLQKLDPRVKDSVLRELDGLGEVNSSGSTVTLKKLSPADIPEALNRLNVKPGAVNVPR